MKFITFYDEKAAKQAGWVEGQHVFDMNYISREKLPDNIVYSLAFLHHFLVKKSS